MQLKPDSRVGPYRITGALGSGGMGVVYRSDMIFGFAIAPDGRFAIARGEPAIDVVILRP